MKTINDQGKTIKGIGNSYVIRGIKGIFEKYVFYVESPIGLYDAEKSSGEGNLQESRP